MDRNASDYFSFFFFSFHLIILLALKIYEVRNWTGGGESFEVSGRTLLHCTIQRTIIVRFYNKMLKWKSMLISLKCHNSHDQSMHCLKYKLMHCLQGGLWETWVVMITQCHIRYTKYNGCAQFPSTHFRVTITSCKQSCKN